jgi:poly-gamma-glutamate capsule biosynthesis protein CapA/YwtB (metallophosphatase superfamily)
MRRCSLFVLVLLLVGGCGSAAPAPTPAPTRPAEQALAVTLAPTRPPVPTAPPTATYQPTRTPAPTVLPSVISEPQVSLAVVGDLMLARSIGERISSDGPAAPLAAVSAELAAADLTIGNLECAIGLDGTPAPKAYRFLAPPAASATLTSAGFDLVSLANNHILDWGDEALAGTAASLDAAGIAHVGAGANAAAARAPVVLERNGLRLAFLGYVDVPVERGGFVTESWTAGADTPGVAWANPELIAADVRAIRPQVDHVIILLHSGYEGQDTPNEVQRAAATAALEAGATLVLGAHPHVLQGTEARAGRLIAWSLGNFVFDGFAGTPSVDSAILHITLDKQGVSAYRWSPVRLIDGYPQPLDPEGEGEGAAILENLARLSQ